MKRCCFCGKPLADGIGNNPWPADKDLAHRCCDECDKKYVDYERFMLVANKYWTTDRNWDNGGIIDGIW